MLRISKQIVVGLILTLLASLAIADKSTMLTGLDFAAISDDEVEIRLTFDNGVPKTADYAIEKPARIALDLLGAGSGLKSKYHNIGAANARSITIIEAKDKTRLILNLTELTSYSSYAEGNELVIALGRQEKAPSVQGLSESVSSPAVPVANLMSIVDVDFRRGEQGEAQVVIRLSDASIPVDIREESGRIFVEFMGATLPEKLQRRLDVADFGTPVTAFDARQEGANTLFIVEPTGEYEYLAYQADTEFTVNVKPVTAEDISRQKQNVFVFTGDKLSLNFQDIEVRSVLQLIADFTSLNLVASDSVSGKITLRLQNVPWDQALDLILKTKGLDKRKVGNVMLIAPADEIAAREKLELEATAQVAALAPLRSEFVQINYAKAKDIESLIKEGELLSARGKVTVDERTNTLVIQDTAAKLEEVRTVIAKLDVPVRQVLIETRVVLASSDFTKAIGVRWGGLRYDLGDYVSKNKTTLIGGHASNLANFPEGDTSLFDSSGNFQLDKIKNELLVGDGNPDMIVDMGVAGAATRLSLGIADVTKGLLEFELSALESDGFGEVVSSPKVLTADQQTATIWSGTQIPFQEATSSGATSTSFKDALLSLEVTPHITPDGNIILALKVHKDTFKFQTLSTGDVPIIDVNAIETTVLVEDGQTVVLGGVYETETLQSVLKTPFFGDLPVIGRLFRRDSTQENKSELLIFVTPKLVRESLTRG